MTDDPTTQALTDDVVEPDIAAEEIQLDAEAVVEGVVVPSALEAYVNPEFFTPKELSQMVAGFGVQIYVSMKGRDGAYTHREAIVEAATIASLAIEDRAIGKIFAAVTEANGFAVDVMENSRLRLKEMLEQQAADAAAALAAGEN